MDGPSPIWQTPHPVLAFAVAGLQTVDTIDCEASALIFPANGDAGCPGEVIGYIERSFFVVEAR